MKNNFILILILFLFQFYTMTTFRKEIQTRLYNNGLFENQANDVIAMYLNGPLGEDMKSRFDDKVSSYPGSMLPVVWISIKHCAVEYIDAKCPQHWARPMFSE